MDVFIGTIWKHTFRSVYLKIKFLTLANMQLALLFTLQQNCLLSLWFDFQNGSLLFDRTQHSSKTVILKILHTVVFLRGYQNFHGNVSFPYLESRNSLLAHCSPAVYKGYKPQPQTGIFEQGSQTGLHKQGSQTARRLNQNHEIREETPFRSTDAPLHKHMLPSTNFCLKG